MRAPSRFASILLGLTLSLPSLAHAGDVDDTVFLKNGGRIRGTVVEDDPAKGLRLRASDGSLRVITPKELDHVQYATDQPKPAPPAATTAPLVAPPTAAEAGTEGALRIESTLPARAAIDGGDYGPTPVEVGHLSVGKHRVSVTFDDDGGVSARSVTVRADATTPAMMEPTSSRKAFAARRGVHFGLGAEAVYWYASGSLIGARAVAVSTTPWLPRSTCVSTAPWASSSIIRRSCPSASGQTCS